MSAEGNFGESDSDQSSQNFNSKQQKVLNRFLSDQRRTIGRNKVFQGDRVADFSGLQNQALDLAPENLFRTQEQEDAIFKGSISDPAIRGFRQETVPLIREEFAGPGFFGSARAQETVRAGEDLASNLGVQRSDLRRETQDINRQGVGSLFDFGQRVQQQEQNEINAEIQKFMDEQRRTNPEDAALLAQLLGLDFGSSEGRSSSVQHGGGGGLKP